MIETKQPCVCLSGAAELAVSREDGLPLLPLGHLFGTHRGFNKRQAGTRLSLCRCTTLFQPSVGRVVAPEHRRDPADFSSFFSYMRGQCQHDLPQGHTSF